MATIALIAIKEPEDSDSKCQFSKYETDLKNSYISNDARQDWLTMGCEYMIFKERLSIFWAI